MPYPDDFAVAAFNQVWGDGPDTPTTADLHVFLRDLAQRLADTAHAELWNSRFADHGNVKRDDLRGAIYDALDDVCCDLKLRD